jgi:hypothetical protein
MQPASPGGPLLRRGQAQALGNGGINTEESRARLRQVAAEQLSAAGQVQVATAMAMLEVPEVHLDDLRRLLVHTAKHLRGAKTLARAAQVHAGVEELGEGLVAHVLGPGSRVGSALSESSSKSACAFP